ncbi:nuclear pore complex component-domain-containing protein [Aspergillus karnatakaensis]|uniref:nuclear pore complex component-domain-containing protein n=1 Tax=Aspergillus karnatakaensis TaxID=1810916 RepID=UPI003CCDBA54
MSSLFLPSTPKSALSPAPVSEQSQTPGKWRHPHLNEIVRRQHAGTFGDRDVKRVMWNGGALLGTWVFGSTFRHYALWIQGKIEFSTYPDVSLLLLRLIFILNILVALFPLFRPKDDMSDIPLTPTQRALLGLDPSKSFASTPATSYATPPKYRVSSVSRAASPASLSGSPLSASASASSLRFSTSMPYSPSPSPLLHKMVANGGRESVRRPSFGSSSPHSRSSPFKDSIFVPASPSPATGKRGSLGLSNKWLYERSRRLSASNGSL